MHGQPSLFSSSSLFRNRLPSRLWKTKGNIKAKDYLDILYWGPLTLDSEPTSFYGLISPFRRRNDVLILTRSRGIKAKGRMVVKRSSLVVRWGCHWDYPNENSDNGNQRVTSVCGVSFQIKITQNHVTVQFVSSFTSL